MKTDRNTTVLFHLMVTSLRSLVFVGVMAAATLMVMESQSSLSMGDTIDHLTSLGQSFGDSLN
ncbi:MAG: hypothetical protein JNN09_02585 [Alphaproteobacteria bacterium]|jgi:hypothetical protein|nr:hypothetical protein [Alphaproteobacteria bacterium]MBP9050081.1 hypothetical protein [Alphaproteobacteria bacterium]MBP9868010.1 hypothetical protein [Alphaproteobacteria bacterium]